MNNYYIYILTNKKDGILYIGSTSNLIKRIWEHKNKVVKDFSNKYNLNKLVYFEIVNDPYNMVNRERQMKKWERKWKINLIEKENPNWEDIYNKII